MELGDEDDILQAIDIDQIVSMHYQLSSTQKGNSLMKQMFKLFHT
jgi:hypothetical protein